MRNFKGQYKLLRILKRLQRAFMLDTKVGLHLLSLPARLLHK